MASILRSSKFVRYFAGFARNIVFNTSKEAEGNLVQQTQCLCSPLSNGFATAASKQDPSLERSLKRIDQDVRRSGRISRRDIEEVLEEIRQQRTATSSQSLLVIRCCGNLVPEELPEVRTALVQEIWKTLNNLKVPMDISHYNALLRVFLENEHAFSPTEFLTDLESKGIEPNRVTYQRLISRYCQQGDIEGATRILEFMREKQLPVNENVFNALIMGHSQADDMESAAGIIAVMQQASLEPSADTYTTLLCGYARKGDLESIKSNLEVCDQKDIFLLDKDYLDIVYALATNGHGDLIDPIMSRLRKSAGYNQDAVNVILRLINKAQEEVAMKILKSMPRGARGDGELIDIGNFFIKQLVKSERPTESILKVCNELQNENLNAKPLLVAIEAGLTHGMVNMTLPLLREAKNANLPIRQHYFWPLLCSEKNKGNEFVLEVLSKMQIEFTLSPSSETLRDYVIPNLNSKRPDGIISMLRGVGISLSTAGACTAYHLLNNNKLKEAAEVASSCSAYYSPGLFKKPLIQSLSKTEDFESFIIFVRQLYDGISRLESIQQQNQAATNEEEEHEDTGLLNKVNKNEVLGQFVYEAISFFRKNRVEIVTKILNGLVAEGLSISNYQAERIQDLLGAELNTDISTLLGKLAAGDLEPKTLDKSTNNKSGGTTLGQMNVEQLERLITTIENKNENSKGIKRYLLAAAIKTKDLQKTEEIVARLESEGYVLTSGVYAQLIDLYCHHEKLDESMMLMNKIKTREPEFTLDHGKTIKLAGLLMKHDRLDDALKLLDENKKEIDENTKPEDKTFNYKTMCWRLLNSLAEAGKENDLEKVFDSLLKNNYIDINNVILGPLVKVHIVNDNLKKAVDKFEEICNKHQSTPWKNELACKLIQSEDAVNLQRLTDLSTNIHGEVNSLYDLVFSFVECGRIRQARKILETPGLKNRPQRINNACERYHQEGMVSPLEGLMEATKDLNHIDRSDIYYNLLLSYCKESEPEKALGLWTKLQEENIPPSEVFLIKLGEFLTSKGLEVPFVIPEKIVQHVTPPSSQSATPKTKLQSKKSPSTTNTNVTVGDSAAVSEGITILKQAIKRGDIDAALAAKQNLAPSENISIIDQSLLIESLIKSERLSEASKIAIEMLTNKVHPVPRVFRFFLNKLAATGDCQSLERVGELLTPEVKKMVSFDNRLCHANIVSGKSGDYLNKLEADIDNVKTDQDIADVAEKFPRGGAVGILDGNPEVAGQFEKMAEKYAAKGIIGPMNVLWVHHFIKENNEECTRIWDKHLATAPRLMFQRIVHLAREKQDEKLIQRLIDLLKRTKVSEGAIGNAYSCLLDVYAVKEQYEDGLIALDSAVKDVCIENINRTALIRIKAGIEKTGKDFPHIIPDKITKNITDSTDTSSSSSSSSDDENLKSKK